MGRCADWTTSDLVLQRPELDEVARDKVDAAVAEASDFLFWLSGRQYPGACERTIRPGARPSAMRIDRWSVLTGFSYGAFNVWGICGALHDGLGYCNEARRIDLMTSPVRSVSDVKIDGASLSVSSYHVDDYRTLVRDDGGVWPSCQLLELPDTEAGTFSVTYAFGADPPDAGVNAATTLAAELAKLHEGRPNKLPARVTAVVRQGVSKTVMDPLQFFSGKLPLTGIFEVDLFIRAVNPSGAARPAVVMSPDRPTSTVSRTSYPPSSS